MSALLRRKVKPSSCELIIQTECPAAQPLRNYDPTRQCIMAVLFSWTLWLFLFLTTVQISDTVPLQNYIKHIINTTFDVRYVIYYFQNNCSLATLLNGLLQAASIPTVKMDSSPLPWIRDKWNYRDGYIIVSDDVGHVTALFERGWENSSFWFENRKPILIFFEGWAAFNGYPFDFSMGLRGLNITTVQGFRARTVGGLQRRLCPEVIFAGEQSVSVTALQTNREVSYYRAAGDVKEMDGAGLEYVWEPDFNLYANRTSFRTTLFNCHPYAFVENGRAVEGVEFRIVEHVMEKYPRTYLLSQPYFYNLLRYVVRDDHADAGFCNNWREGGPLEGLDVTTPYDTLCITCLAPKPHRAAEALVLFRPFRPEVWCVYVSVVLASGLATYLTCLYHRKLPQSLDKCLVEALAWYLYNSMSNFARDALTELRFLVALSYLAALLITTGYSAGYTSNLAIVTYADPTDTIQDLLDRNVYFGALEQADRDIYSDSHNPTMRTFASTRFVLERSFAHRYEMTRRGNYCVNVQNFRNNFITETNVLDDYGQSHLKVLKECFTMFNAIIFLQTNSPFVKMFNEGMARLLEHGILNAWYEIVKRKGGVNKMAKFFRYAIDEQDGTVNKNYEMNLNKLVGAVYILLGGYFISTVVFAAEMWIHRKGRGLPY